MVDYSDDELDDSDDWVPRKKGKGKSRQLVVRGKGKKGRRGATESQLLKWAKTGYGLGSEATAGLKEKLSTQFTELSKQGTAVYKDVHRKAKAMRSSAFEAMLLKATWPDDDQVAAEVLNEIIKHSIPAFKYGRSSADDDPYHMTLHKLWTKMCEKDWRTVTKSVFILHCISRDCQTDSCQRFAGAMKAMSKVRNPKNPTHKYFDSRMVSGELDEESKAFKKFVASYWAYVLHRARSFSAKFAELKDLGVKTPESKAVAALNKAQAAISKALECRMEEGLSKVKLREKCNAITGQACRSVSADLRDLWKQFVPKVEMLARGQFDQSKGKAEDADVARLLEFTKELKEQISSYLGWAQASFQPRRVKISTELEEGLDIADIDTLIVKFGGNPDSSSDADTVESVTGISGGHVARKRAVVEDSEEDSEEEDDDDEYSDEDSDDADDDSDDEDSDDDDSEGVDSDADDDSDDEDSDDDDSEGADSDDQDDSEDEDDSEEDESEDASDDDDEEDSDDDDNSDDGDDESDDDEGNSDDYDDSDDESDESDD
jgi:hypothetical protein